MVIYDARIRPLPSECSNSSFSWDVVLVMGNGNGRTIAPVVARRAHSPPGHYCAIHTSKRTWPCVRHALHIGGYIILLPLLCAYSCLLTLLPIQLHFGFRGGPGGGGGFVGEPRNWFINSSTKYLGNDLFSFGPGSSVASPGRRGSFGSRPCLWSCTLRWMRRTVLWKPGLRRICSMRVSQSVIWRSQCSFRFVPARRCNPAKYTELAGLPRETRAVNDGSPARVARRPLTSRMRAVLMM